MNVTYEIKTTEVKNYNYRTPLIGVDADDKLILKHSKHTLSHIKSITLLNLVGRNESGKIVSYEPMEYVNRFLLAHHIENDKEETMCAIMSGSTEIRREQSVMYFQLR